MEGDEPECEHLAEGEEWADYQNQEDWPDNEATYEEPGEQGAICCGRRAQCCISTGQGCQQGSTEVAKGLWSRQALEETSEFLVYALEASLPREPLQRNFGLWIPRVLEKQQGISYREFLQAASLVEGGHWRPSQQQCSWMLGSFVTYLVPHGQKPYPLWDQVLGKIKDVEPASGDDEVLHRAQAGGGGCVKLMDKQKEKMRERLLYGPPDQEGWEWRRRRSTRIWWLC